MSHPVLFFRSSAISIALFSLIVGSGELRAQVAVANPPAKTPGPDQFSQDELLKSYLHVREQLHAAELAIANNRLEAEAAARAQAAAIAEKLDAIKAAMADEREIQVAAAQRAAIEREREQVAARDANRTVIWIAGGFAVVGVITMFSTALLQWSGIKRMTAVTVEPQPLPLLGTQGWLAPGRTAPFGDAAALSNQRLMSVIDRMERRILELEHTAASPSPSPVKSEEPMVESGPIRNVSPAPHTGQGARVTALLGKGRSLLNANKAKEAVSCYDEILAIDANHPEALVKKGSALERLKRDLEAIECYDRAIKADRNLALAYLSKGGVFNRLQRFDEAVECYEQALKVEKEGKQINVTRVSVSGEWPANGSTVPA